MTGREIERALLEAVATGDGMAMAHRAEAVISNMEFVQFHPTALADEGLPIKPTKSRENAFLITEAVRGDGGILYNLGMEWFMPLYDERAELAPRDVVASGIDDQLKQRNEKLLGLNAILDHRGEVFIPELGLTFRCPPSFRDLACQNPSYQGGGRKGLPRSFSIGSLRYMLMSWWRVTIFSYVVHCIHLPRMARPGSM
ncbi:hypothetical protein Pint_07314 [Pistacia integerrima]|uniref:Uncharacterized protein n=1 Tax=Pistacia integerrima TaxID=434235 RepID=A0ACC0XUE6_9ROSI|nr:hypothetical protein Pint_07314 [Pistacia integerrima]